MVIRVARPGCVEKTAHEDSIAHHVPGVSLYVWPAHVNHQPETMSLPVIGIIFDEGERNIVALEED
jgi:hypothetical protein